VDDDVCFLDVSKQILAMQNNFDIDNAMSVDEAFKKMEQQNYDAIVSDFEMPQKNGLDFLKELRDQNNQIPFILFTGKGREDVAIKALNLGADRYINKQGNPETVYGELSDALIKTIEHKQSKKMLVESESKYRKLVENSLQGIAIIQGPPPKFVFANAAMKKLFGYTPEEMIALSSEQIIRSVHPDDRDVFFDRFKKRIEGKEPELPYVFRGFRKDGTLRWVEVCANLIEFNGKPAVQAVFLDITENKRAEENLRESEQKYRELANCLPDIVFETNLNGQLEFANEGPLKFPVIV
jgi:PAS domain S-box-containing protein